MLTHTAIQAQRPIRIQRQRTKGWRMPPNTVYVGRPTKWGNPFRLGQPGPDDCMVCANRQEAVDNYRSELLLFDGGFLGIIEEDVVDELRGKNLACWCPLDQPCHADVLLEIANAD